MGVIEVVNPSASSHPMGCRISCGNGQYYVPRNQEGVLDFYESRPLFYDVFLLCCLGQHFVHRQWNKFGAMTLNSSVCIGSLYTPRARLFAAHFLSPHKLQNCYLNLLATR